MIGLGHSAACHNVAETRRGAAGVGDTAVKLSEKVESKRLRGHPL